MKINRDKRGKTFTTENKSLLSKAVTRKMKTMCLIGLENVAL
jgi:hypothetical protein